jgi:hypothetical protein
MATWSEAFAAQARSDMAAYEVLKGSQLPISHQLHYLQMWLEKLCKARLWMREADLGEWRFKHNVVAKVLPSLISKNQRQLGFEVRLDLHEVRELCREIDMLHPQVDDAGRRPENVEYPWLGSSGAVEIPAKWKFAIVRRMYSNTGRQLLKAAAVITRNPVAFIH